ncbi:MAG: hypothetical protein K2I53_01475 [Lachnospiraceae bacterium]|nr:hypothetical protein [Lachnospiraceae bacterium]
MEVLRLLQNRVLSGGTLKVGGEIGAGLYGGVGLAKVVSAGIYGEAAIGLKY